MNSTDICASVVVPIVHFQSGATKCQKEVVFSISRDRNRFRAIPWLSREEREPTGLPAELEFVYYNHCIIDDADMEDDTLNVIRQIILELENQETPD